MNKKFTFIAVFCSLTFTTVAQNLVCPQFFKRNNGNAGTCDALITFQFLTCPTTPIQVDALLTGGINGTPIPGLTFSTGSCSNGKVDVCINGSNIPTAGTLTVVFSDGTVASKITCDVPSGGSLPILLSSFSLQRNNANVTLVWETQQEINTKNFEIQRAYDNSSYQTIATVPTHANSSSLQSYLFNDNTNNSKNISFYRIKMVDINGDFTYTSIKSVKGSGARSGFIVFPNPSFGNAKISISEITEPTVVHLLDNSGRVVKSITLTNTNIVELNNLKTGTYIVKTIGSVTGASSVQKLTVIQ